MDGDSPFDDDDPKNGRAAATRLQEFFLPIHGYVRLRPEEIAIVNHPAFQRLRLCRQLGFAHLVFPGAVHTRFEHSIGAVYVSEKIIQYVNFNYAAPSSTRSGSSNYQICKIDDVARRFIRLGALLHDIGHIPFGHTLEDELEHLEKHDGEARVDLLAQRSHKDYLVDDALQLNLARPDSGWTLEGLINAAYRHVTDELFSQASEKLSAYDVLKLITLKAPVVKTNIDDGLFQEREQESRQQVEKWQKNERVLGRALPASVCRDIIGNTICADFLDYLFRDWYHVGKPMTEDRRLYQYMEVRSPQGSTEKTKQEFVINVGPDRTLRHDALTSIFELLEGRYKLAETVLFHRTKLAMTALLDRCFLELRHLYEQTGLKGKHGDAGLHLGDRALDLLLESSDDQLPSVVRKLAVGATEEDARIIKRSREQFDRHVQVATNKGLEDNALPLTQNVSDKAAPFDVAEQCALIEELSRRLEHRTMYTLACRVPRRRLDSRHKDKDKPELLPPHLQSLAKPEVRHKQILMLERLLQLPAGSVALYAPPSARMNAKIAQVKLLIDGEITPFFKYEKGRGDAALTGGLLAAQVQRFHELWGVSIYVNRPQWHLYSSHSPEILGELEHFLRNTVYVAPSESEGRSLQAIRDGFEPIIAKARVVTARGERVNSSPVDEHSTHSTYSTGLFASQLPYRCS